MTELWAKLLLRLLKQRRGEAKVGDPLLAIDFALFHSDSAQNFLVDWASDGGKDWPEYAKYIKRIGK